MGCLTRLWIASHLLMRIIWTLLTWTWALQPLSRSRCVLPIGPLITLLPSLFCKQHATRVPPRSFKNRFYEEADANGHKVVKRVFLSWWQGKYVFTEGKEGAYYLLKADALGAFNKDNNNGNAWQTIPSDASSGDKSVSIGTGGIYSGAAYWPAGARLISTSCSTYIPLKAWG
jgi:hypothetical protein